MKKSVDEPKAKKDPACNYDEHWPFPMNGQNLSYSDVTYLAEVVLWSAFNPGTLRSKETINRKFDQDGTVIEETTEKKTLPPDWRAAEAWLHIQALKNTNY